MYGTQIVLAPAFYPQTDSYTEHQRRAVEQVLRTMPIDKDIGVTNWSATLLLVELNIKSTCSASIKFSLVYFTFG